MDTIDVLLPYYGNVEHLKTATESVLAQDYPYLRLVVLNDAYPDPEPARWFDCLTDSRVAYHQNEKNLGANRNYQKALDMAQAPVFVMMGADDVMLPSYLRTIIKALEEYPQAAVVQPGVEVIDGEGVRIRTLTDTMKRVMAPKPWPAALEIGGEDMAASLLHAGWHYFPSLAWRTDAVRRFGFRPEYDVVQDLALLVDIAAAGGSMMVLHKVVFQYRRHSESDSSLRAADGRRFAEERRFYRHEAMRFRALGWRKAALAADLHWTSRLHALSLLLSSTPCLTAEQAAVLGRHILT